MKNGRISKVAGLFERRMLSLRPIMGDDGHGSIAGHRKVRGGTQNAMRRLVELIAEGTREAAASSLTMVLSYRNCPGARHDAEKRNFWKMCGTARGDPGAHQRPVHGIRLRWRHRAGLLKNVNNSRRGGGRMPVPDGCFAYKPGMK